MGTVQTVVPTEPWLAKTFCQEYPKVRKESSSLLRFGIHGSQFAAGGYEMESKKFAQHGMLVVVRSLVSDRRPLLTLMLALLMPMFARGQSQPLTIAELFGFPSTNTDGTTPDTPVIQASDGNLYGTPTLGGNDGSGCVHGCAGTVFKLTPQGQITVLYTFAYDSAQTLANGATPRGGLVEGGDGYLYGTTLSGGLGRYGVVFKISKTGQFQKLHDFCATSP